MYIEMQESDPTLTSITGRQIYLTSSFYFAHSGSCVPALFHYRLARDPSSLHTDSLADTARHYCRFPFSPSHYRLPPTYRFALLAMEDLRNRFVVERKLVFLFLQAQERGVREGVLCVCVFVCCVRELKRDERTDSLRSLKRLKTSNRQVLQMIALFVASVNLPDCGVGLDSHQCVR